MRVPSPSEWRDNYLRSVEFRYPEWVIGVIAIPRATWLKYGRELEKVVLKHRFVFPFYREGSVDFGPGASCIRKEFVDPWGCRWRFPHEGLQGQVVYHPLEDWDKLGELQMPDPDDGIPKEGAPTVPWEVVEEAVRRAREEGGLAAMGMGHGFFFQRLYYLRGYVNLLRDLHFRPPQLFELVEALKDFYLELVRRAVRLKPDVIYFGDDLGNQDRMPFSPRVFREVLFPAYREIFGFVRRHGIHVHFHSDGHVVEVLDQLVEAGASILNVQDRVNGIANLKRVLKGKICIDLDVDRQQLLPQGTPREIDAYVRETILELGSKRGGLMFTAGVYPDVPLRNIDALASAFEKYSKLHLEL